MEKIILLITMILLPIASFAKGNAYGNTEWGMTPSQVIEAEKGKAIEIPPVRKLNFQTHLKNIFCILKMQNIFKTQNCSQLRADH